MLEPKSENKGIRTALESVIIQHVKAYEAGEICDTLDEIYLGMLESTYCDACRAEDRTRMYGLVMHLKDFLYELQSHALDELPETQTLPLN